MKKDLRNKILATAAGVTLFTTMALGHNTPWGIFGGSESSGKVTTYQYATADDLGSANSFAVVAEEFNKDNHMEGTFATGSLITKGDICGITGNVQGYINPNENLIYIGDVDDISNLQTNNGVDTDLLVLPKGTTFDYSFNNNTGVSVSYNGKTANYNSQASMNVKEITTTDKTDYKIDFSKAMSSLSTYANARMGEDTVGKNTTVVKDSMDVDFNNRKIVVDCGAGKNVITITADELENYMIDVKGSSNEAFSLVVNVTDANKGTYNFNRRVTVNGNNDGYGVCGGLVLFNFAGSESTLTFQQENIGVVLAPKADVVVQSTHNGSVFAKTVKNDGCEIHQNPFKQFVEKQEETTTVEETTTEEITTEATTEETTTEEITTEEPTTEDVIIETEATTEETTTEEITTEEITTEEPTTEDVIIETEATTEETTTEEITTEEPTTEEVVIETETTTEEPTTEAVVIETTTEAPTEEITTEAPTQDVVIETEATTEAPTETTTEATTQQKTTEAPTQDVVVETQTTTVKATEEETEMVLDEERESEEDYEEESEEEEEETETDSSEYVEDTTPQTGDNANIPLMAMVCVVSLAGVIVLKRVKKEN